MQVVKRLFAGAGPCGQATPGLPCPSMPFEIERHSNKEYRELPDSKPAPDSVRNNGGNVEVVNLELAKVSRQRRHPCVSSLPPFVFWGRMTVGIIRQQQQSLAKLVVRSP